MATVLLGVVGTAIAGPVGGAVGAVIGSVIDNAIINALRAPTKVGQIEELRAIGVDQGAPVAIVFGPRCRVAGQLIWQSPIRAISRTSGGGLFGGPRITSYRYFYDVAFAVARSECDVLNKVWIGGELVYDTGIDPAVTGAVVSVSRRTMRGLTVCGGGISKQNLWEYGVYTHSGVGDPNAFARLQRGVGPVTIAGFANAANNGVYEPINIESDADGVAGRSRLTVLKDRYTYQPDCTPDPVDTVVAESEGASVSFFREGTGLNTGFCEEIIFHDGAQTQMPDSLIESYEGAGNVPAWRGLCYIVIKGLEVTKYVGQIPNVEVDVTEAATRTIASVLEELLLKSGKITSAQIDVSDVTGTIGGFVQSGEYSPLEAARQLMFAYALDFQNRNGVLYFFHRQNADLVTVATSDLGAAGLGDDAPLKLRVETIPKTKLPKEYGIDFIDANASLQPGYRSHRKTANPLSNVTRTELPLVLTPAQATQIAKRAIYMAHIVGDTVYVQLPMSYKRLIEGDHFLVEDNVGVVRRCRVKSVRQGAENFMLMVEAHFEDITVVTQSHVSEDPTGGSGQSEGVLRLPGPIRLFAEDLPPLADDQAQVTGLLIAANGFDSTADFDGYIAWVSDVNSASNYVPLVNSAVRAVTGDTLNQLAAVEDNYVWDRKNSVTVLLDNASDVLESLPEETVMAGANMMLVGREIIHFATATLIAPRTYTLTNLIRGARNTENFMASHAAANDPVLLLSGPGVVFASLGAAFNSTLYLRATHPTESAVDADETLGRVLSARTRKPFSVYAVRSVRNAAGDITLTWQRRTRLAHRILSGANAPIDDLGNDVYEIDVRNDADNTTVAQYSVTNVTTWTYTATQQITDYGITKSALRIRIYKVSSTVGRGEYRSLVV